jgi:hypothetical protein
MNVSRRQMVLSPYRGGENRVTSSIMAVFERIDLELVREILAAATEAGDLTAVTFENQVPGAGAVADARIAGRFEWLFETKTTRGAYAREGHSADQLRAYRAQLKKNADALLFVVTPHSEQPELVGTVSAESGGRVLWTSFGRLRDAIEVISARLYSEQTRFLLDELVSLFEVDGLLSTDDTVIVAARWAWPDYLETAAYICQPDRSFRADVDYLGFYTEGEIKVLIAKILARHPSVVFSAEQAKMLRDGGDETLAQVIEQSLARGRRTEGESYGVFVLSGPDDRDTVRLKVPIENDTRSESGRTWAWTLSQRYTRLERLRSGVTWTSQL